MKGFGPPLAFIGDLAQGLVELEREHAPDKVLKVENERGHNGEQ